MTIRTKLIFWFLTAALLPATAITYFAAGEAGQRFNQRAEAELQEAQRRGVARLREVRESIVQDLQNALGSGSFQTFRQQIIRDDNPPDWTFARRLNEELNLDFDFLLFLDYQGTVLSSYEWPVFAGKQSLEWQQLKDVQHGDTRIGRVETDEQQRLALRAVLRLDTMMVAGGREIGPWLLPQFRTSVHTHVFLHDGVSGTVYAEQAEQAELGRNLRRYLNNHESGLPQGPLRLEGRQYLVAGIPLSAGQSLGSLLFLYPRAELDEEIAGLWNTFLLAALAGIFLAFIIGLFISVRFTNPLRDLLYGFELVALGDFSHRISTWRRDELGTILTSFNSMAEELENVRRQLIRSERIAAWQEIARKIAHEIKNPLSPIQISIETLRKVHERKHPEFEAIFEESTQTILEEVEKIRVIVQEFSDFARMPEPSFEPTDLKEVLEGVIRLFRPQLEEYKLHLNLQEVGPVMADKEQLHRAILNVLKNALQALENEGSTVSVVLEPLHGRRAGSHVRIMITDDGPGVAEQDLRRIFTPYFTTKEDGTGLGLVIVQKIIEQHNGRLNFRSSPGTGTSVSITLPLA